MLQISEVVARTEAMFDQFNNHFYAGELLRPAITIAPDGGHNAYGWCTVLEVWRADGGAYREINICADYLDRPLQEIAATMLHEMAHLYDLTHDIKDVSNNGYYHNSLFKATAEAHGLHIEKHTTYGWTVTTVTPETAAWLDTVCEGKGLGVARKTLLQAITIGGSCDDAEGDSAKPTPKKKGNSIKYTCPKCGAIIRATKHVNVVCGDCMVPFEAEDDVA